MINCKKKHLHDDIIKKTTKTNIMIILFNYLIKLLY